MDKILLALAHFAFLVALSGDVSGATITSCGTLSTAGETYILSNDIGISETCLTIGASNIVLDCTGYSITGDGTGYGIYASGRSGVVIKNCNVRDYQYGIYLNSTNSSTLDNDTVSSNIQWGIILDSSSFNSLTNNTAYSNGYDGILLDTSSNNNTLTDNNASFNTWYGIYLDTSSEFNILDKNIANSNGRDGIRLTFTGFNTFINNTVNSNNDYGIFLGASSSNTIYNNHFNNTNNFYLSSSTNIWNTTKQAGINIVGGPYQGGNFWAKPDGTGFSETCADVDKDGFCDSSYPLDSSNVDYLPLYFIYFNGSVKPIIATQGDIVTANATTNYDYATMWVTFTWYSPSQTVGGASYVKQVTDATNVSGLYQDKYTITSNETGDWTVRMEFKTSDGVLVATRDVSFEVISGAPEFSLLAIPFISSLLVYAYMRRRFGGWKT